MANVATLTNLRTGKYIWPLFHSLLDSLEMPTSPFRKKEMFFILLQTGNILIHCQLPGSWRELIFLFVCFLLFGIKAIQRSPALDSSCWKLIVYRHTNNTVKEQS